MSAAISSDAAVHPEFRAASGFLRSVFHRQERGILALFCKPGNVYFAIGVQRQSHPGPAPPGAVLRHDPARGDPPGVAPRLLEEAEGIVAWALAGTLRWRGEGLGKPPEVEDAGARWRAQFHLLREFVEDCCVVGKKSANRLQVLGCEEGRRKFGRSYSERGWVEIALRAPVEESDAV